MREQHVGWPGRVAWGSLLALAFGLGFLSAELLVVERAGSVVPIARMEEEAAPALSRRPVVVTAPLPRQRPPTPAPREEAAGQAQLVAAEIADSLYATARRAGLPSAAVAEIVRVLSWDVDLQRELHPGDRLEVLLDDGVAYVALQLRDRRVEAYRHTGRDGRSDYFDAAGRALRRSLLRTPVDGARLSSVFGPRRHPILGFTRMHKGIDFAAPPGTPVLAAGDGVVEAIGRDRGHGKYVRLRHRGGYGTAYAHLSRFAARLKQGQRVTQGQVIGHVGSTGLSTGPHLHYEVLKDGVQVNPLGEVGQAFADRLAGPELRRFRQLRAEIDSRREAIALGEKAVTLVAQD